MKGLAIRQFRMEDRDAVLALWKQAGILRWDPQPRTSIQKKHSHSPELFFVGEMEGRPVATIVAGYDGLRGWLYRLAVLPELQRRGIGRTMVERAEAALRGLGCVKVKLQIEEEGQDAVEFYRQLGYRVQQLTSMAKTWEPPPGS